MVQIPAHLKSSAPNLQPELHRPRDPGMEQRRASDPLVSVWVGASAGTGKTKVLTDRVLRLMLPRPDGQPGTPPPAILGITFTRAGASEMALRINSILGEWAVMAPDDLTAALQDLLGHKPTKQDISTARKLFAEVVDTPGGLKIMTIHAFCQSVLSRFPLEAGLPPYFTLLEEAQAGILLRQARDQILAEAEENSTSPLGLALRNVAATVNNEQFLSLLASLTAERGQMQELLRRYFSADGLYTALCAKLGLTPGESAQDMLLQACDDSAFDMASLRQAAKALGESTGKKEPGYAAIISDWLSSPAQKRTESFPAYEDVFLVSGPKAREKDFPTKSVASAYPDCIDILRAESQRLLTLQERLNSAACAGLTRDVFLLGQAIVTRYSGLKIARAALDFDDLILTTVALLEGRTAIGGDNPAGWVLYKLDQGIEHILIDEAQDTNPEQWKIIKALCEDFFAGTAAREHARTVFTVGDEKQSIYSFQRASPEEFDRMHRFFEQRIQQAEQNFENVSLDISFRSTLSVLRTVDATFRSPDTRKGLGLGDVKHEPFYFWRGGRVELWPLIEADDKETPDFWAPPIEIEDASTPAAHLAERLAATIKSWLDKGEILPSYGRPIRPGDIMILVRTRTAFVAQLTRALRMAKIPVSGSDRMILNEQLAVQDLLALAEFALMPSDDLTLACVLKSPLIGLSEDALYDLAYSRAKGQLLWSSLQASAYKEIVSYLASLIAQARDAHPYEFFGQILGRPCPANTISGLRAIKIRLGEDSIDPLDELLSLAMDYEASNIPSLQGFLHWQAREQTEIKRQLGEHAEQVRIMTVHGSKGLQAPIVILPDTTRTSRTVPGQQGRRLIWPDKSGLDLPLWSPRSELDFDLYRDAASMLEEREDEEYRRLLYVAMTRAEDRLYVCGFKGSRDVLPTSWYNYIREGMSQLEDCATLDDGSLVIENKQTREVDRKIEDSIPTGMFSDLPTWIFEQASPEDAAAVALIPSRLTDDTVPSLPPRPGGRMHRFRRGNLTHKLLQLLPGLPEQRREDAASRFIARYGADLPEDVRNEIVRETLNVLGHSDFAEIFDPGSQAEVPLTGRTPTGQVVSAQIDRLLVKPDEILIVDYKTNRPPPQTAQDAPLAYKRQLQAYADALRGVYPGRRIRAALLWTDGPRLMEIAID